MHPFWWLAPPPSPRRGDFKAPLCCRAIYYAVEPFMKRVFRGVLFCPRLRGKSGAARIGGGERSEPIRRMPIKPYDTESKSRNADFILIVRKGDTTTLGPAGPVKPKNPPAAGRSILRTFFTTLLHNLRRQPRPFFIKLAAKPPPQPSARRAVKLKNLKNLRAKGPSTLTPKVCPRPAKRALAFPFQKE